MNIPGGCRLQLLEIIYAAVPATPRFVLEGSSDVLGVRKHSMKAEIMRMMDVNESCILLIDTRARSTVN
jgi:hypothetical protein